MKFIEDIRNRHSGEEIWIIGAGSSLDDYPIDFFKDKICVGMNWVFSVFLDVGDRVEKFSHQVFYSVHEHGEPADWIAKHKPEFLKNCFFLLPPERRDGGGRKGHQMVWWEDYNKDPYYMRWGLKGKGAVSATDNDFAEVAKCIMAQKGQCHYVCRGTTLHWAIEAAVVLGARKIYVAGTGGQGHVSKHGFLYRTSKVYGNRYPHWREGTRALARAFRPYGVEIVYHYYGKGEQSP